MEIGPFHVDVADRETICDQCRVNAIMVVDGQPQCAEHAGITFMSEPAVLGELVLALLSVQTASV